MTYDNAIEFLFGLELYGIKLGLHNITKFLGRLGNPHREFKSVHVAGTNGKGTTASMIEAILLANGYKVGKFTSPHLVDYRERVRINGAKVARELVADFVSDNLEFIRDERITFFETATALAFEFFRQERVDIAVVEVGLGGRLDATNVLEPEVSVITQIAHDHVNILGQTLDKIAFEKAGIIKPGIPVVTSAGNADALGSITRAASERGSELFRLVCDKQYKTIRMDETGTTFIYYTLEGEDMVIKTNMIGRHMAENAALALAAMELLDRRGFGTTGPANCEGLRNVCWPARFQVIDRFPRVVFDAAHNPHGMKALADTLQAVYPDCSTRVVLGTLQRPDIDLLFDQIARFASHAILCTPDAERAEAIEEMVRCAIDHRIAFTVVEDAAKAFDRASSDALPDERLVVTGSHHTVGEVFKHLDVSP
jgi:dihydrofolate synthase/folylpolyglutamate synthase